MKPLILTLLFVFATILCAFDTGGKPLSESDRLEAFELQALRKKEIREYVYDLTRKKACNKTRIKYLGVARTNKGKQYKLLTTVFVYSTGPDMCHGSSAINIYDMKNRFVGAYYVGGPESLPDTLVSNRLLYLSNSEDCELRKSGSIDLSKGLPRSFYLRCSKSGGDIFYFSGGE